MAIVNVKNLPDPLYRKLRERARRQHRSISQEVIHLLSQALDAETTLSILELQGLGKARWRAADAARHDASERRSWACLTNARLRISARRSVKTPDAIGRVVTLKRPASPPSGGNYSITSSAAISRPGG